MGNHLSGLHGLVVSILPEPSTSQHTVKAGLGLLLQASFLCWGEKSDFKILQGYFPSSSDQAITT